MASDGVALAALSNPQSVLLPPDVVRIADAWAVLPPHIRETMQTLVDAGLMAASNGEAPHQLISQSITAWNHRDRTPNEALARRIARRCQDIFQGRLREGEWQNAEHEFFEVVASALASSETTTCVRRRE